MLNIRSDNSFNISLLKIKLTKQKIKPVSSIQSETNKIIFRLELKELQNFFTSFRDFLVGFLTPSIFHTFTTGIIFRVIFD